MQLELIYTQDSRCLLRLDELFSIDGIPVLQTFLIDCLDGILTKTGNLGYLLQSVSTGSQKITCILIKLLSDPVPISLERNFLHVRVSALAEKLNTIEGNTAEDCSKA